MNDAVKYFKKNGLQRSKELVEMGFGFCSLEGGLSFHTEQLKQLVESHELVESKGGLTKAKEVLADNPVWCFGSKRYSSPLEKAIADVESCMESGK